MQVRCTNCHRPFAINKETVYAALDEIRSEDLSHYNAFCPHCRRANRISPKELKRAAPNWKPEATSTTQSEE
ncbi:unnamed protein product [marine sediment metagenome]|uniref:CpXC domain-containing protein n=1 Tax=marine sediment metagenome TaxID=412755 RepID=X1TB81_9ZZZZ